MREVNFKVLKKMNDVGIKKIIIKEFTMKMSIILLLITILISCSKKETYTVETVNGIKTFRNTNIPADPNFKITAKELFTINGSDENTKDTTRNFYFPLLANIDSKENVFIIDRTISTLFKFNNQGKFIKSFGRKGNGPGEMKDAVGLTIFSDTLYIADHGSKKTVKFDIDGNFINDVFTCNNSNPLHLFKLNSSSFVSYSSNMSFENDKEYLTCSIQILDNKFNIIKVLKSIKTELGGINFNVHDYTIPFTVGRENIFVANVSSDKYIIHVYNFKGDLLYIINKHYAKIPMPKEDLENFSQVQYKVSKTLRKFDIKFKKFVNMSGMFCDKDDNLLVQSAQSRNDTNKEDFIVDVFKDGIYKNTIKLDIGKGFDYFNIEHRRYFFNNKIYYVNREDNYVKVFEY